MKEKVDIKTVAVGRAIQILDSLGARYKIIMEDGSSYGVLEAVEPKISRRAPLKYAFGAVRNHIRGAVGTLQPGEVGYVPVGPFDVDTIQNGTCSFGSTEWGNGSVITRRDVEKNLIEVLRVA
jgi:hypothetical protein